LQHQATCSEQTSYGARSPCITSTRKPQAMTLQGAPFVPALHIPDRRSVSGNNTFFSKP